MPWNPVGRLHRRGPGTYRPSPAGARPAVNRWPSAVERRGELSIGRGDFRGDRGDHGTRRHAGMYRRKGGLAGERRAAAEITLPAEPGLEFGILAANLCTGLARLLLLQPAPLGIRVRRL